MLDTIDCNKVLDSIVINYPNVVECSQGHIGDSIIGIEQELEDDRYIEIKVSRCSHCNLPDGGETE